MTEDHADTCEVYETALNIVGFDIACVRDAHAALAAATGVGADVIVIDPGLPGVDGWQLIEMLRAEHRTASIPIVMVSGQAAPEMEARAFALGCVAFFVKPCLPFDLAQTLRSVIYRSPLAAH